MRMYLSDPINRFDSHKTTYMQLFPVLSMIWIPYPNRLLGHGIGHFIPTTSSGIALIITHSNMTAFAKFLGRMFPMLAKFKRNGRSSIIHLKCVSHGWV